MSKPELTAIVPVEKVLELAKKYPVFPCRRTDETDQEGRIQKAKSPLTRNGFKDATQEEAQIRRWWAAHPAALVGVPTGSGTGLVVIDFDHRAATQSAQDWLVEHQVELTKTRVHQTGGGSGGRHYLFRAAPGVKIRGGASVTLGKVKRNGLDIRAEGGYIIWWPLHYGQSGPMGDIQPLPAGLIDERRMDLELPAELASKLPPKPGTSGDFQRDLPRITEALAFIDPSDYDPWLMVGMALHYASGGADDGLELWDAWSSGGITGVLPDSYAGRADIEYRWQSFHLDRRGGVTLGSLFSAAKAGGWQPVPEAVRVGPPKNIEEPPMDYGDLPEAMGMERVREPVVTETIAPTLNATNETQRQDAPVVATFWQPVDPKSIPPREWLYGFHYMRRMVNMTAGAGGGGKSSVVMVEAISMAIGRDLLRGKWVLPTGPLRVWIHNGEDPLDEINRRLAAICLYFDVDPQEVAQNLLVTSGRDTRIIVAEEVEREFILKPQITEQVIKEIQDKGISVLILDPFVSTHAVQENNNPLMEKVLWEWRHVADRTGCSIEIVHHFRKGNGNEVSADDVRGATAIIGACRSVRVVSPMNKAEAEQYGVDPKDRRRYFWLQNPKANMRPPTDERTWRYMETVELGNATGIYTEGDSIGVPRDWLPPTAESHITPGQKAIILRDLEASAAKDPLANRIDPRSSLWAGRVVARHLEFDPDDGQAKQAIKRILEGWVAEGSLKRAQVRDHAKGRNCPVFKVVDGAGEAEEEEEVPF